MKHILLISVLILCTSVGSLRATEDVPASFEASEKLEELASLPVGLAVSHTPDPVRYTLYPPTLSGVRWQHNTTVSSLDGLVTITEFGYFVERNGQWEFSYGEEVPCTYTSNDFAESYDSPNSELQPGELYSDMRNQSIIDCVPEQMVKWYYIGVDAEGNRVKGEATAMLLAELDPSEHGPQN